MGAEMIIEFSKRFIREAEMPPGSLEASCVRKIWGCVTLITLYMLAQSIIDNEQGREIDRLCTIVPCTLKPPQLHVVARD